MELEENNEIVTDETTFEGELEEDIIRVQKEIEHITNENIKKEALLEELESFSN